MPVPDFSPGEVLTAAAMDSIGLWLVKTVTVGTGVSSVVVSNCFNANFDSYRIVISGVDASAQDNSYYLKLSGSTGSTYSSISNWLDYPTRTFAGTSFNNSNLGFSLGLTGASNETNNVIDIHSPFKAAVTTFTSQGANSFYNFFSGGRDSNAASSTGCEIVATVGQTFTGGTIRVYGYRN